MRASWAFLVFIGIPLLEIYLFIAVGGAIGAITTIVLIVLTAVVGVSLMRIQGWSTLARARQRILDGEHPALEAAEGVFLLIAGVMLLIPGFATDALGFLLLIPKVRRKIIQHFWRTTKTTKQNKSDRVVIEGEYEEHK